MIHFNQRPCGDSGFLGARAFQGRSRRRPTGVILAAVLVALLVVMMLGAALTNAFLARRKLVRESEWQQQGLWLAESAMQRAEHRLATEPDYAGDTWQLPPDQLNGTSAGVALIRVEAVSEPQPGHRIFIDASYPSNGLKKSFHHRERFIASLDESAN